MMRAQIKIIKYLRILLQHNKKITVRRSSLKFTANFLIFNYFLYCINKYKINMVTVPSKQKESQTRNEEQAMKQGKQSQYFKIPEDIKKKINKHRMILVMDLDETMVFTRRKRKPKHQNFIIAQINQSLTYVQFRPHIGEFLLAVSELFTIYVYTAGSQMYADAVLDLLPNSHVISKRFYRQSCINHRGDLIKDLKIIRKTFGQAQKQMRTVLVDDNGTSISYNHPHAFKAKAFLGSQQDKYLRQIFNQLMDYYRIYSTQSVE